MIIQFLDKFFLYFLPLAAVPVIIHLLFRKKKKIEFSNVSLIKDILSRKSLLSRWQKYLLLLIRTMIVLAVVFVFARPWMLYHGQIAESSRSVSVVFLFDVSCSMNYSDGESELAKSKNIAMKILEQLPSSAKIGVIAYSDIVEYKSNFLTTDRVEISNAINKLAASFRKTSHRTGLTAAQMMLDDTHGLKSIVWLTDAAKHGFDGGDIHLAKNLSVIVLSGGAVRKNAYISNITQLQNDYLEIQTKSNLFDGEVILSLYDNGVEVGRMPTRIRPDSDRITTFWKVAPQKTYYVEMKTDALPQDNRYFFSTAKKSASSVLIVDGNPQPGYKSEVYYLVAAMKALGYKYDVINFHQLAAWDLTSYDGIILSNYLPPDENSETLQKLRNFVGGRKKILVFLGDEVEAAPAWMGIITGEKIRQKTFPSPTVAFDERFGSDFRESFEWRITAGEYIKIFPPDDSEILISDENKNPFMISMEGGNIFIFNTTANKKWSDFASKPFFAPMLKKILAPEDGYADIYAYAGENAPWPFPEAKNIKLKMPGKIIDVSDGFVPAAERPGFYEISFSRKGQKLSLNLIVNVNPAESELLAARNIPIKNARVFSLKRNDWRKTAPLIIGKDISAPLWAIVLIFLAMENVFIYFLNKK